MIRTYLITGANRGIGLGLTKLILENGHRVYGTTRNLEKSMDLRNLSKKHQELLQILELDVESPPSIAKLPRSIRDHGLDVLVNNAGVYVDDFSPETGFNIHELQRSFNINTIGTMLLSEALLPLLKRSPRPTVATITSKMGSIGDNKTGGHYGYRMSKAALNMWCRCFAHDHKEIVSVVLHPGWVKTDMGGMNAPTSVEESCKGLLRVMDHLSPQQSGHFFDYKGHSIEW